MLIRALKILAVLAIACLLTIGTAVIGSRRVPRGLEDSRGPISIDIPATAPELGGSTLVFAGDDLGVGRLVGTRTYMGGIEQNGVRVHLSGRRVGWPFSCSEQMTVMYGPTAEVLYEHGHLCNASLPPGQEPSIICGLPAYILWLGALADVAIFTAVPLTLNSGLRLVRTRLRIRGRRCPHCGYSLQDTPSSRCPECGRVAPSSKAKPVAIMRSKTRDFGG